MQLPPPEIFLLWPAPNYENPITRGPQLLVVTVIFLPIAIVMVCLRIFTRLRLTQSFGIDDIVLLLGVLPTIAIAALTMVAVDDLGWDRHIWDVKIDFLSLGLKFIIAMEVLFATAVSLYKLSLLILIRRIMTTGTGILRHIAAVGMFIVAAEGAIFGIVVVFTCRPVSAYWTLSDGPQTCINESVHLLIGGIINTLTDFLVFFLPIPTVISLKIHRRQQIVICMLFSAGFAVCIAGCVRIYYTWKITEAYDRTWAAQPFLVSSVLELYIGTTCAAMAACKPFFSRYLPSILGSTFHGKSTDQYTHSSENYALETVQTPAKVAEKFIHYESGNKSPDLENGTSINPPRALSSQMLPLSYLDAAVEGRERSNTASTEGSSASAPKESPPPEWTPPTSKFCSVGFESAKRTESREELVTIPTESKT